ncbi:hypothetical protein KKF91_16570 [Myxococcota bacterium]|nr:hypothetical protein [Myxococcota bacterium]MBU1432151.1 hypothetical protein [Myxococcota bacterium]MBU1899838.1 hypothetical protein [Myxococcota bacterium]
MLTSLLALSLLSRIDAQAEIAHDLGLNPDLRGTITLSLDLDLLNTSTWALALWTEARSYVRENRADESPVRISPQQIHYPVGARLHLKRLGFALFAFHQSNHDIDTNDAALNRETLSYEWYGVAWRGAWGQARVGFCYDRGTRLDGRAQLLPFDHYYAAADYAAAWTLSGPLYLAARLGLIAHADDEDQPSWLDLDGAVDLGLRQEGARGAARLFLRFQRLEGYQHLADAPEHMALLGLSLGR